MKSNKSDLRIGSALRILLVILSVFIMWSLLALVSSAKQPTSMPILFGSGSSGSQSTSLANSAFSEILGSYFSLFSLTMLALIVLAAALGLSWSRNAFARFLPLPKTQSPLSILLKRLLAASPQKPIHLSESDEDSEISTSSQTIFGPALVYIEGDNAVLIADGRGRYRVVISNSQIPVQITGRERVERIVPIEQRRIEFDSRGSSWEDISKPVQITYRLNWPEIARYSANRMTLSFLEMDTHPIHATLEEIMQLEFDALMRKEENSGSEISQPTDPIKNEDDEKETRTHSHSSYLPPQTRMNALSMRNRKRRIYSPEAPDAGDPNANPMDEYSEQLGEFMQKFSSDINKITTRLFGVNAVEIIDYRFGGID